MLLLQHPIILEQQVRRKKQTNHQSTSDSLQVVTTVLQSQVAGAVTLPKLKFPRYLGSFKEVAHYTHVVGYHNSKRSQIQMIGVGGGGVGGGGT